MDSAELKMIGCLRVGRTLDNKGFGLFVTANIPANTVISCEEATMYASRELRSPDIQVRINTFCDLYSASSQADRCRLNDHACNLEHFTASKEYYENFENWYVNYLTRQGTYDPDIPREEKVLKLIKSWSTFWTNCASSNDGETGLWSTFARANHSCRPNTLWRYVGKSPYIAQIVTMQDLPAGTEVTVSYSDLKNADLEKRRRTLQGWGFLCKCERCTEDELAQLNKPDPHRRPKTA
ncbi:SET domain-containing protein [Daldinia eschscholtzii]|nr:SET domain-containing protein [Daldinia eschscholtzii]